MNRTTIQEQLSALADGHLQGEELTQVVGALRTRDDLQVAWRDWHLVGDVLRTGAHSPCSETSRFVERLRERLAEEPAPPRAQASAVVHSLPTLRAEAANAPVFRWKLVAGAASLAAAAAIGWNWVGSPTVAPAPGAQLALQQAQPPVVAATGSVLTLAGAQPGGNPVAAGPTRVVVGSGAPQVMLRDARLDELLAAHQQAGGASQMPSGFLRNATFEEGPSR